MKDRNAWIRKIDTVVRPSWTEVNEGGERKNCVSGELVMRSCSAIVSLLFCCFIMLIKKHITRLLLQRRWRLTVYLTVIFQYICIHIILLVILCSTNQLKRNCEPLYYKHWTLWCTYWPSCQKSICLIKSINWYEDCNALPKNDCTSCFSTNLPL